MKDLCESLIRRTLSSEINRLLPLLAPSERAKFERIRPGKVSAMTERQLRNALDLLYREGQKRGWDGCGAAGEEDGGERVMEWTDSEGDRLIVRRVTVGEPRLKFKTPRDAAWLEREQVAEVHAALGRWLETGELEPESPEEEQD